jgi:hypothetical protein
VKVTFESSYEDAGDAEPSETHTDVLQAPDKSDGLERANTLYGGVPGIGGIISLYRGDDVTVYGHEVGHVMGCEDHYSIEFSSQGEPYGKPEPEWEWNMYGGGGGIDYRNIKEIVSNWERWHALGIDK